MDKLLMFALPLAVTGILSQLFNAADVAIVGRFVGSAAMAAVGCNTPVISLLVSLFLGVSLGVNVVISRLTGMKNEKAVSRAAHTGILFSLLSGLFLLLLGEWLAPKILMLLSVPEDVLPMAVLYLRIYFLGMPVIFLYNFESAIFRSRGDTRTPLACLTIAGVINVILNVIFVVVCKRSVDGVAWATVISNAISSMILLYKLARREDAIRISLKKLRMDWGLLKRILHVGMPVGLQSTVFAISNILVQSAVNSLGSDVIAGASAAFNIEIFVYYLINSFGQACATFVGQNYGAGNVARCRKITARALLMDVCVGMVLAVVIYSVGPSLLSLFNTEPAIISCGMVRLKYILFAEGIAAVIEVFSGTMQGYEQSTVPAVITFLGVCSVRITWVYTIFRMAPSFGTLMICYPLSWAVTGLGLVIAYLILRRRLEQTKENIV